MKFIALILFLFPITIWGQSTSISGVVKDSKGKPVEFVNIAISGTLEGAITDEKGFYSISNVNPGKVTVAASFLGYRPTEKSIQIKKGQQLQLNFDLKETATELDQVVLTGTMKEVSKLESPVPVEVYTPKYFQANPSPSVFACLQNVNGVRPQLNCNVCNTGDIHINGLEGPYTMVLIDGMPIVSGLSTVYGLTGIPSSLIERVEIVKGPASTLYGSEAVGGLINIITKKPGTAPAFSADVFTTSWLETNADIGLRYHVSDKSNALLGINYFNYQNPIDNNKDGFTDITLQDRISIFNKIDFERKDSRTFSIAGRYLYEDRWGGQLGWGPEYRGGDSIYAESIYTSRWEAFGVYQLPTKELINLQFSMNSHQQNSVYGNTSFIADQYIGFTQLSWHKSIGKSNDLLVGMAYRYTYYDDNTPATAELDSIQNAPSRIHLPGVFVQDEIKLNEQNKVLLGVRYDYNSIHGDIFSPRINYKWNSSNKRTIARISAGNGFRVANVFTEDHAALTGARTVVFEEELSPETSWNTNINLVQKFYLSNGTAISLDGTIFYTYFTNRIVPDYETNPNLIIYDNLDGSAVSQGVSLNADISFLNGFNILLGGTAMDVTIEENGVSRRQLLTEQFTGVWNLGYTFKKRRISVDYTGNLYGPMRLPLLGPMDDRPEYSPWWSIQNIKITKEISAKWMLYGGAKNLLNYTPPANSIARAFDPFDRGVQFDANGNVVPTPNNPKALTFDPSYVFAPNQGIRVFFGIRYRIQ